MVTAAKAALDLHVPNQFFYVCKYEVQLGASNMGFMRPSSNTEFYTW